MRQEAKETMNIPIGQEVYIRLAEDREAFLCTITFGKLYSKTTEFPLHGQPELEPVAEHEFVLTRKKPLNRTSEQQ